MTASHIVRVQNPKVAIICGPSDDIDYGCVNDLKRLNIPSLHHSNREAHDDRFLKTITSIEELAHIMDRYGYRQQELLFINDGDDERSRFPNSIHCTWSDVRTYVEFIRIGRSRRKPSHSPYDVPKFEQLLKAGRTEEALDILRAASSDIDVRRLLVSHLLKIKDETHQKEAFTLCSLSPGDPELTTFLARFYYEGEMVPKDVDRAIEIVESVNLDSVPRYYSFRISLYRERNSPADVDNILGICRSKCGLLPSLLEDVGRIYDEGKMVPRNIDTAIGYFESALARNLGYSKNRLVDLYIERNSEGDYEKAFNLCNAFSASGNPWATGRLARMYRDGLYVEKDIDKAAELMRSAADAGVGWAVKELRSIEAERSTGFFPGMVEVAKDKLKSSDMKASLILLEKAFGSVEDADARIIYSDAIRSTDPEKAFKVLSDSADRSNPTICGRLARMYRDGKGTERNIDEAIRLFRIASDGGIEWARLEYPDVLMMTGSTVDRDEAVAVLMEDALKGVPWSQIKLARIFESGTAIGKDAVMAMVLLRNGLEQGIPSARNELSKLEKQYGVLEGGMRP